MEKWITVNRLSCEIERVEGIFGVLINRDGDEVDFDNLREFRNTHYNLWSRSSTSKTALSKWKELRLSKIIDPDRYDYIVLDPESGDELCETNEMGVIRGYHIPEYRRVFWPNTMPISFHFECPEESVVYRLKEELLQRGYEAEETIHQGGWFSCPRFEVKGCLPEARIFPWEFLKLKSAMEYRAKVYSSKFSFL